MSFRLQDIPAQSAFKVPRRRW